MTEIVKLYCFRIDLNNIYRPVSQENACGESDMIFGNNSIVYRPSGH